MSTANERRIDVTIAIGLVAGAALEMLGGPWATVVGALAVLVVGWVLEQRAPAPEPLKAIRDTVPPALPPPAPMHPDGCPASLVLLDPEAFGLRCVCGKRTALDPMVDGADVLAVLSELGDTKIDVGRLGGIALRETARHRLREIRRARP